MSYHIYRAEGFVIGSVATGEANRYFHIYTRELGMIVAHAQGIRLVASKLRGQSREYSCADLSLIRGKRGWKLTSVSERFNLFDLLKPLPLSRKRLLIASQIFALLRRLAGAEEENQPLYALVAGDLALLADPSLGEAELDALECAAVLGMLHFLGYLALKGSDPLAAFLAPAPDRAALSALSGLRARALAEINRSLRETQL